MEQIEMRFVDRDLAPQRHDEARAKYRQVERLAVVRRARAKWFDLLFQRGDEFVPAIERRRAPDLEAFRAGEGLCLHVQVVEDLEVVGHEADGADQGPSGAGEPQRLQEVRSQPGLPGAAGGLKGELPGRQ